jgi:hypothetical protein
MPKKQLTFELHLLNADLKVQLHERLRVSLDTWPEICANVKWPNIQKKLQERQEKRGWCDCKILYISETGLLELGDLGWFKHLLKMHLPLYVVPDPTQGTSSQATDWKDLVLELDQPSGLKRNLQLDVPLGEGGFGWFWASAASQGQRNTC